jgi:fructose-1,6-bisphosphatase I
VKYLKKPTEDHSKPYNFRYIATAVADIHRTLYYGGIYLYPAGPSTPQGKIRLIYEANPLAMIVEQAGGRASNGKERLLSLKPESIHQTTPFYVGSEEDVLEAEQFLRGEHPSQLG